MRRLLAGLLGAVLFTAPAFAVSEVARAEAGPPCSSAANENLYVKFSSPKAYKQTDYAEAGLTVHGKLTGKWSQKVTAVELFADGTSVGKATLKDRKEGGDRIRLWSNEDVDLSVGHHMLQACARTSSGAVVGKLIHTYVTAPLAEKVLAASQPGDSWMGNDGEIGHADLAKGHHACVETTPAGTCTEGTWPDLLGVPKIWSHSLVKNNQNVVTFTKTFTVTAEQAKQPAMLDGWADDVFSAQLNGTEVLSGDNWTTSFSAPVTLKTGKNTVVFKVTNTGSFDPQGNPAGGSWKISQ
ncbi:hypothetical protein [Kineosporia babensis]|uniref:Uncharacterized protein n=1 Tax=Kineosporia babensis TaxID=499548 RepID=A0A9X1NBB6_9ACTN|nr:hypothetical protein [Kineosporia babensis]MCD5310651.1 hypothetical protein [Kineosporia babensis]